MKVEFAVSILLFFLLSLVLSQHFHYIGLKTKTKRILKRLQLRWDDMHCSMDHLIYFIQLPCHNVTIKQLQRSDFYIKKDYSSLLFPTITGLRIYAASKSGEDTLIAYLGLDKPSLPQLSEFLWNGTMTQQEAELINVYKALHPSTSAEILDEVYRTIHKT